MPLSGSVQLSDVPHPELSCETSVLAISCDRNDHARCDAFLRGHFNVCHASSVREAGRALDSCTFSVALTPVDLADGPWASIMDIARHRKSGPLIIVIEGTSNDLSWEHRLANGASDVLQRPRAELVVLRATSRAASRWRTFIQTSAARVEIQRLVSATPQGARILPCRWPPPKTAVRK